MNAWLKSIRPDAIPLAQFLIFAVIAVIFGLLNGPLLLVNFLFIGVMTATGLWMMNRAPKKKAERPLFYPLHSRYCVDAVVCRAVGTRKYAAGRLLVSRVCGFFFECGCAFYRCKNPWAADFRTKLVWLDMLDGGCLGFTAL